MLSRLLSLTVVLAFGTATFAKDDAPLGPPGATLEEVQNHPDDAKLLNKFVGPPIREIRHLIEEEKYDEAQKKLAEFKAQIDGLKATGEEAKEFLAQVNEYLDGIPDQIALAQLSLADVEKALTQKPDDEKALENWT